MTDSLLFIISYTSYFMGALSLPGFLNYFTTYILGIYFHFLTKWAQVTAAFTVQQIWYHTSTARQNQINWSSFFLSFFFCLSGLSFSPFSEAMLHSCLAKVHIINKRTIRLSVVFPQYYWLFVFWSKTWPLENIIKENTEYRKNIDAAQTIFGSFKTWNNNFWITVCFYSLM
jgi:hypothetical protein